MKLIKLLKLINLEKHCDMLKYCFKKKNKERSLYDLTDKEDNVKPKTIVFESFGKNYSDSPKIFMNICKSIILIIAIYGHLRILKNVVPGSAEKVKRNSAEYYQAYRKQVIGYQMPVHHFI